VLSKSSIDDLPVRNRAVIVPKRKGTPLNRWKPLRRVEIEGDTQAWRFGNDEVPICAKRLSGK